MSKKDAKRIKRYFHRTWRNKLWAMILLLIGYMFLHIDNDSTLLVCFTLIAVPLFFARTDWTRE